MKTLTRILNIFTSALLMMIGVVFVFIEGYLLFSGDFLLFELQTLAFIQMFLRLLLGAGAFLLGLFTIIKKDRSLLSESLAALIGCGFMYPFLSNGFGLYFTILATLHMLTAYLYSRSLANQEAVK